MDKTIQIFRGLLNLRSYNRVFTAYCTSHKDSKDSSEKHGTSSKTWQKSAVQNNNASENKIKFENIKREDEINLSSGSEVNTSNQTDETRNFNVVDQKVEEPVKSEAKSVASSAKDFPTGNKNFQKKKLKKAFHNLKVDHSYADFNLKSELQPLKEKYEANDEGAQKSKLEVIEPTESFASLLRKSAFVDLGDPVNKLVIGEIYLTVDDDLYVEFGWKFPAICRRPRKYPEIYNIGAKVLLKIKDLELTARFLGEKEYTSLLEAECEIIYRVNEDGSKFVKKSRQESRTSGYFFKNVSDG